VKKFWCKRYSGGGSHNPTLFCIDLPASLMLSGVGLSFYFSFFINSFFFTFSHHIYCSSFFLFNPFSFFYHALNTNSMFYVSPFLNIKLIVLMILCKPFY